jgi:hypothetical protein
VCKQCKPFKQSDRAKQRRKSLQNNPEWKKCRSEYAAKRTKERKRHDIQFLLKISLRSRISCIIWNYRKKGLPKSLKAGSAVKDLGCSMEELIKYLESLFQPGMSWENYGKKAGQWSIDHIYPLSKLDLTDREQFLKGCHFNNLQPLWYVDNLAKGNKTSNLI